MMSISNGLAASVLGGLLFAPVVVRRVQAAGACVTPKGLENVNLNFPEGDAGVVGVFGELVVDVIPSIEIFETPIQFRNIQWCMAGLWGCTVSHNETALDIFGRNATARRCLDDPNINIEDHAKACFAYAFIFCADKFFPPAMVRMTERVEEYGLNPKICEEGGEDCSDTASPWGLAYTLVEEINNISRNDGWNAHGSYNQHFNTIPFMDWRSVPYHPAYNLKDSWKPLLESNGLGLLSRQEHVTPHIGQTGKSFFLGDAKLCGLKAPPPQYKYSDEIELALNRSAHLDDKQKIEIECFDSKVKSLLPLIAQFYVRQGISLDSFEYIFCEAAIISAMYEATLTVWKEKVYYDLIRPTTIVHNELKDEVVDAWGGPFEGTQSLPANEWQPYIRTMPHSEYPSGSSCVCAAVRGAMIAITGSDDVTSAIGGPLALVFEQGSSRTEPGAVPKDMTTLTYNTWSEIAEICGQSRLNGGMHFTAAVPAGDQLCESIGYDVVDSYNKLASGMVPGYTFNTESEPREIRCPQGRNTERRRRRYPHWLEH